VSTPILLRDALVATLEAIVSGRVVSVCGETRQLTHTLAGLVTIGTNPEDATGGGRDIAVSVGLGGGGTVDGDLSRLTSTAQLGIAAVVAADSDEADERQRAAGELLADMQAAIVEDYRGATPVRIGTVPGVHDIKFEGFSAEGGEQFERRGVVWLQLTFTWSSALGV